MAEQPGDDAQALAAVDRDRRERDCITLVRAIIRELSGREPIFELPAWADGLTEEETIRRAPREGRRSSSCPPGPSLTEEETIRRAPREHGTLRQGWIELLDGEPRLRRVSKATLPASGMIALTSVRGLAVDRAEAPVRGPLLGVIGPDCALWVRSHEGLSRAWPVADRWEVR